LALKVGCTLIVATHSKKGSVADLEAEEATAGSGMVGRIGEAYISLAPHEKEKHLIARYKLRDGRPRFFGSDITFSPRNYIDY